MKENPPSGQNSSNEPHCSLFFEEEMVSQVSDYIQIHVVVNGFVGWSGIWKQHDWKVVTRKFGE